MDINTIIAIVSSLVAIGVSWGLTTAKIESISKEVGALDAKIEKCTTKESCLLKHDFVERNIDEIKADLREIKDLLKELSSRKAPR